MQATIRANARLLSALAAMSLLAACSTPTLTRSVAVETYPDGVPVHASGELRERTYVVAPGDTLYSIAFRVGQDFRDLARWNGIRAPYTITPGQHLRVVPPRRVHHVVTAAPVRHAAAVHASASAAHVASRVGHVAADAGKRTTTTAAVAGVAAATSGDTRRQMAGVDWQWPASGKLLKGYRASDAIPGVLIGGSAGDPVRAAAGGTVVYSGNGLVGYGELIIIKHSDAYLSAYGHNRERLVHEGEHVHAGQVIARMGSSGAPRVELEFQIRRDGKPVDPQHYLPKR